MPVSLLPDSATWSLILPSIVVGFIHLVLAFAIVRAYQPLNRIASRNRVLRAITNAFFSLSLIFMIAISVVPLVSIYTGVSRLVAVQYVKDVVLADQSIVLGPLALNNAAEVEQAWRELQLQAATSNCDIDILDDMDGHYLIRIKIHDADTWQVQVSPAPLKMRWVPSGTVKRAYQLEGVGSLPIANDLD